MGKLILALLIILILLVLALIAFILIASDDHVGECSDDDICGQDNKRECIHWTNGCNDCPVYRIIIEERERNE